MVAEFRTLHGPAYDAFADAIMFPDSSRRKLQDSIDAASGLTNTGEMQRAVFANGLLSYRFAGSSRSTMPVLIIAGGRDGADGPEPSRAWRSRSLRYRPELSPSSTSSSSN